MLLRVVVCAHTTRCLHHCLKLRHLPRSTLVFACFSTRLFICIDLRGGGGLAVFPLSSIFFSACVWVPPQMCTQPPPMRPPSPSHSPSSPEVSLPFCPSLRCFTRHHQGLASWCLHCKSGPAKIRTHSYSKAPDLFIHFLVR